ncbi:MAG: hypothetical protein IKR85_09245 [Clostridia bacterium]|nr:hypothetical protein [Clostridia bacterium]
MKRLVYLVIALLCCAVYAAGEDAVMSFTSFFGGGPEYSVNIEDQTLVSLSSRIVYGDAQTPVPPGAEYMVEYTFTGVKPGRTTVTVSRTSPIAGNGETRYILEVDADLNVSLTLLRELSAFRFTRGGYMAPQSFELTLQNGEYMLSINDEPARAIDKSFTDRLQDLTIEYELDSWDGFNESAQYVLDGEDFSLSIEYTDGTTVDAYGSNSFPTGYFDAAAALEELLTSAWAGGLEGTYRYTGEGFGGDFTITLNPDGTYTYYEGALSSYIGSGRWNVSYMLLYMYEENDLGQNNTFRIDKDRLIFSKAGSDNFLHVKLPDGAVFEKTNMQKQVGKDISEQ